MPSQKLDSYLEKVLAADASDLHIGIEQKVEIRVDGSLQVIEETPLTKEGMAEILAELVPKHRQEVLEQEKSIDFSYDFKGKARFRVNVYYYEGRLAAALRLIPATIRTIGELGLPKVLEEFANAKQGLVLSVGPTGHGKTTTLAAIVEHINTTRNDHIITIEDPIEYLFTPKECLINQREVGHDTNSFAQALKMALRQDPDVVLVGEMRDLETIQSAITLSETGHLVLSTLHTNDASQTIDRMVDVFPPHQQQQIRIQLADVLLGLVSQRLVPKIGGGRIVVTEILKATPAVRNLIREGKSYQLKNVIQTSSEEGMVTLETSLAQKVHEGTIDRDTAMAYALDQKQLLALL